MAMRAGRAAPPFAAASAAMTAATTPGVAGRFAIGIGRLAHIPWLAGFARLARAVRPARDLIGRPVNAPDHLAERLDLTLVSGFLALGFLDQFEQLVHRLRGIAQSAERRFDLLERLADAGGRGGLGRRWRRLRTRFALGAMLRWRSALARRTSVRLVSRHLEGFRRRFSCSHFLGSGREERFVFGATLLAGIGIAQFRASLGGRFGGGGIGHQFIGVFGSRFRGRSCGGRKGLVARAGPARASASAAAAATAAGAGRGRSGSRIGWRCWIRHVVQRPQLA